MELVTVEYASAMQDLLENTADVPREIQTVAKVKVEATLSVNKKSQKQLVKFPVNVAKDGPAKHVLAQQKQTSARIPSQTKYVTGMENAIAMNVSAAVVRKDSFAKSQKGLMKTTQHVIDWHRAFFLMFIKMIQKWPSHTRLAGRKNVWKRGDTLALLSSTVRRTEPMTTSSTWVIKQKMIQMKSKLTAT